MRQPWGKWARDTGKILVQPCSVVTHYGVGERSSQGLVSGACDVCDAWQTQVEEIIREWRAVKAPAPVRNITRALAPTRQIINTPVHHAGRKVVHDPALMGYVYIASNPIHVGWVKIGSTVDLQTRLCSYQTGDPHRRFSMDFHVAVDDRLAVEQWLLRLMGRTYNRVNEWVECSISDAIEKAKEGLALIGIDEGY